MIDQTAKAPGFRSKGCRFNPQSMDGPLVKFLKFLFLLIEGKLPIHCECLATLVISATGSNDEVLGQS